MAVIVRGKLQTAAARAAAAVLAAVLFLAGTPAFAANSDAGQRMLIPLGNTAGIRMFADGVLVVGISEVCSDGKKVSPAADAGIKIGDRITEINSVKMDSASQLRETVNSAESVDVKLDRGGKTLSFKVKTAVSDDDGTRKLGAWVRDSLAGIGTLTYYDPATGAVGALGHGVTDTDTKELMPLASGSLVYSSVESVRKGAAGSPGELQGKFEPGGEYGRLIRNTERGIFGYAEPDEIKKSRNAVPAACMDEVEAGEATILSSVSGEDVKEYSVKILKVYSDGSKAPRDMLIEVTDPELIEITGGIVQGMSGSPIMQNGKIIGAVTHVLINEPTKGYGIFIENMLGAAD